jgi:catalase
MAQSKARKAAAPGTAKTAARKSTPGRTSATAAAAQPGGEPTTPRGPLRPPADQTGPSMLSPTGQPTRAKASDRAQAGDYLTTAQGLRLPDTDHSLKAGPRGPVLLQDHHLREKITHFDHERIPERAVHARGAAAHGTFRAYGAAGRISRAAFLAEGVETPVFVRFSTVLGSRGSADTVRDTRGFATKFYTAEGTFDLVGNNIPVFFIQDAIKFPDLIHAAKPHPDREIPQAQSAHDTFWDFVSLHTEATHHTLWNMSDRGIPRSYRMMEGFGIHTFRLSTEKGKSSLVKFHWKPTAGVHSLLWEEAQLIAGTDPDFHRRDLAEAIEAGAHPQWELGVQVFPDTPEQTFEGIDLLDPTKLVPEELAPVQPLGIMTLTHNPANYFAETEQVAFHPGHLVPGIDPTDDPLLSGRLFSYLDTQISRLGGPNFGQLPINRPHAPVNDDLRDGMHQSAVHTGVAPYKPNTLGTGCPFTAGADAAGYIEFPVPVADSVKERRAPASFGDHTSQPRLFWLSLTAPERDHVVAAYTFELSKCQVAEVKERTLRVLADIDAELCEQVAAGLGLPAPAPSAPLTDVEPSPALSQLGGTWPVQGRVVGIVADATSDLTALRAARKAVTDAGMTAMIIAPTAGDLGAGAQSVPVQRTFANARSVEFDALLLACAPAPGPDANGSRDAKAGHRPADTARLDPRILLMVNEAFRHAKPLGGWVDLRDTLTAAGCSPDAAGIVSGKKPQTVLKSVIGLLGSHRVWDRFPPVV